MYHDDGLFSLAVMTSFGDSNFGPGARHTKARRFEAAEWELVKDYVEDDFVSVMRFYSQKAVRRAEHHRAGGYDSSLYWVPIRVEQRYFAKIKEAEAAGRDVEAFHLTERIKDLRKDKAKRRKAKQNELIGLGISPDMLGQPTVKFIEEAARKRDAGKLTVAEYEHFVERVLPSLTGQLGANMHPRYRNLGQWAQTYQTWRLLPLALFSSIMDGGVMAWNIGDLQIMTESAREAFGKLTRDDVQEMGEYIGTLNTVNTEHYLNNNMGMDQNHLSTANQLSEVFFRLNGMHQYTEILRKMSTVAAQRLFIKMALKNDAASRERLKEYGLTPDLVKSYISQDGKHLDGLMEPSDDARKLGSAINLFVDESVMRPDVATRPWWATHPVGKVLFFLKGFMYQFQAVVLRKLLNRMKQQPGSISRKALTGALVAAPLVMATLPLTMLGYELRRQVGTFFEDEWLEQVEKRGVQDYMMDMVRRSGYLGIIETPFMMADDRSRGSSSLNALLGPMGGQLLDGVSGGVLDSKWWFSSLPVAPAFPALR
jgi:hypothetical protein